MKPSPRSLGLVRRRSIGRCGALSSARRRGFLTMILLHILRITKSEYVDVSACPSGADAGCLRALLFTPWPKHSFSPPSRSAKLNYEAVVRAAIREIGYVNNDDVFHADQVFINNYLTRQSPDIAQGVDAKKAKGKKTAEQGAGDQGIRSEEHT